jgi:hypothetical protein
MSECLNARGDLIVECYHILKHAYAFGCGLPDDLFLYPLGHDLYDQFVGVPTRSKLSEVGETGGT